MHPKSVLALEVANYPAQTINTMIARRPPLYADKLRQAAQGLLEQELTAPNADKPLLITQARFLRICANGIIASRLEPQDVANLAAAEIAWLYIVALQCA